MKNKHCCKECALDDSKAEDKILACKLLTVDEKTQIIHQRRIAKIADEFIRKYGRND